MNILHSIGELLRPVRSGESKLIEAQPEVAYENASIEVSSTTFTADGPIPEQFTADGTGDFPAIKWDNIPPRAVSMVLIIEDPDAPKATPFVHGIFYNIPATTKEIATSDIVDGKPGPLLTTQGVRMGTNSMGQPEYMSPTPPPGHGVHHYHFQLLALDKTLDFDKDPSLSDIRKELRNHVFAYGDLIGTYERR